MSTAISVYHGEFGRAALYHLDRPLTLHAHREGHLVFYLDAAPAELNVAGIPYSCNPLNAVAVNPWELHNFGSRDSKSGTICLVLYIRPDWFTKHGLIQNQALRFARPEIRMDEQIECLVKLIADRLRRAAEDEEFDQCLFALTDACYRASHAQSEQRSVQPCETSRFNDFRIRKSIQIMQNNMNFSMDMDQIARESGLSRPHFFKLFRRQTGLTPHLYMNTLRVETAIDLVTDTRKSVTDIGLDLGFSSQSSFTRFFSLNVGMPPTDYRRVAQVAAC
ncbi:MAG: AraC family transcriptional regulator [Pseudomonadota bacterium]